MELLATGISILHLVWILLVIFGAFWTRGRPFWTVVHLLSLGWGIIVEAGPWPCPMTLAEQYLPMGAGLRDVDAHINAISLFASLSTM